MCKSQNNFYSKIRLVGLINIHAKYVVIKRFFFSFRLFSVQYAVHLYGHLKEWCKNPHWSFSCCLALVLPLISLPGEMSGLAGTNVLDTQLDTGHMEMTTITDAVKDSGIVNVTLEEGEGRDYTPAEDQGYGKCDQGAQTVLSSIFVIANACNESVKKAQI